MHGTSATTLRSRSVSPPGSHRITPHHGRRSALRSWALVRGVVCVGTLVGALTGCASYEARPLDLSLHRELVDARVLGTDDVRAFAERLRDAHASAPERYDPADGLTLGEGEVLALFHNADLRLARLEAGVALAGYEHAGLWEDPVFGFDGADILSTSGPFEYGLTLSMTIPVSGRLGVERARAGAAYESALRRVVDAEWNTRAAVRRAWAAWTIAEERVRLVEDLVGRVERIGSITDRLGAAGELARTEARLFEVERVERRAGLDGARLEAERARVEVLGLLGLAPGASVELIAGLPGVRTAEDGGGDGVSRLIERNTELDARRAEYREAEESLRLEVRKQYPDIEVGSGLGSEGGDERLLLGLSMPVPLLNANRGGIAEASARREVARAKAEATFERLTRELSIAQSALDRARRQSAAYEQEVIPLLETQGAEVEQIARLGEVDTLLLLETVTHRLDAEERLLTLRLAEVDASITLTRLLGPERTLVPAPVHAGDGHEGRGNDDNAPNAGLDGDSR